MSAPFESAATIPVPGALAIGFQWGTAPHDETPHSTRSPIDAQHQPELKRHTDPAKAEPEGYAPRDPENTRDMEERERPRARRRRATRAKSGGREGV
uniref:Uncharacterized protein n=1 Tax=Pristionchus pacificus TaxID=54126 RepID=A0A2A6CFN3_PRIPA|eukprot:PDM77024.1 hypothetical protein PRIPAC_42419 [Pristionchus pacificus]